MLNPIYRFFHKLWRNLVAYIDKAPISAEEKNRLQQYTVFISLGIPTMAVYGLVTKRDLSGMGSFMFMGLIGIIIASIVNIFLKSSAMYWTISVIGVMVFVGLTAYDVQKIKNMGEQGIMEQGEAAIRKGSIIGALALYLDFINLFLMLLRFFGGARD